MNTVKEMKRQITELEKIFVIYISDRQLESRKLKQLLQWNDDITNTPNNKNWAKNFITEEDTETHNIFSHQGNAN